jgi:hypothetical protein
MRATHVSAALSFCLIAGSLSAQSIVDPAHFKNTEANSQAYRPFGGNSSGGWRYLQVHDGLQGAKATINQLAWRRDQNRTRHNAYSFRCTLILSTAKNDSANIDATFDNNHGANKQTVVTFKEIKWPGTTGNTVPSPFEYVIKFDSPYAFDGTNGGLCWEAPGDADHQPADDALLRCRHDGEHQPAARHADLRHGLLLHSTERAKVMSATGASSMNWRNSVGTLYLDGSGLPRSSVVIGVLGLSRSNYLGLPLPFMVPGSSTQYSGACYLNTSLDFLIPSQANTSGSARVQFPVPATAAYDGLKLYGMYLAIDNNTNALPLVTSNGVEFQWVEPYPTSGISRVYSTNQFSTSGSVNKNYGLVTGAQ